MPSTIWITPPPTADDKTAVLEKLRKAVTERGDYTIAEFNDALYYASKLQKAIDEAEDKLLPVYTTGSWTELQSVLSAVKTEWNAADGDPEIATDRIAVLYSQMQRALNQSIEKTLAVEIVTNADGVNNIVTFGAVRPVQNDVPVKDGQNGYAYPVYNTKVELAVAAGTYYDVAYKLDGVVKSDIASLNDVLKNVTDHHQVEILFKKQTVGFKELGATEAVQINKGEDITRTLSPKEGEIIIPGGAVKYTVGGTEKTTTVDGSGRFTIPAADVTGDLVITNVSGAVSDSNKEALNKLLDLADNNDAGADKTYGSGDYTYTQESWEALFGTAEVTDPQVYDGAYGDAVKVKDNDSATPAQIKAACDKLSAAIDKLKKQHLVTLPSGFTIADGQTGVASTGGNYYVAHGGSVALNVAVAGDKTLNKVTYKMNGQPYTAWEAGGKVTLYGVIGDITDLAADASAKGFSVVPVSGGIGAAEGTTPNGKTYVLTPETGNELVSITVDGVKNTVPNTGELEGVVTSVFNGEWTENKKTVSVNGKNVLFSQIMSDDDPPIPTGKVAATLPGIGEVTFEVSGDVVTVTVNKAGSLGYAPGTTIAITTDGTPAYSITDVKLTPPSAGYTVDFGTPTDGATVEWSGDNSGNHGVTAVTTLKTYAVTVSEAGDPAAPVGGINVSAATVRHGGSVTLTIPTPADATKEVGMDSTLTATIGTKTYTGKTLTEFATAGYAVTIRPDGSANVVLNGIDGTVNISAAVIKTTAKDTVADANKLRKDKDTFKELLDKLQKAIEEANKVTDNDGNIYDDTTALNGKLNEKKTLEHKLDVFDSTVLDRITDEAGLIEALKNKLGVTEDKTVEELLAMIETAADELTEETNNTKKNIADGVISVTTGGTPSISADPTVVPGRLNPNGGSDLVIKDIETEPGYLPIVTIVVDGEEKPFKIVEKTPTGYEAVEPIYDVDGNITGWEPDANEDVIVTGTIDSTDQTGDFTIKIENADIIDVLGKDKDNDGTNDIIGDITAATTESYLHGRELPTAQKLYEDTYVSAATKGVTQISIDVDNDGNIDFKAGTVDFNKNMVPVIATSGTAIISIDYTEDTYTRGGNTWYKTFAGITLGDLFYPAGHMPNGITFTPATDAILARKTGGTLTIDTGTYTGDLGGIKLSFEPTNSQFTTWRNELSQAEIQLNDVLRNSVDLTGVTDADLLTELGIADLAMMESGDAHYDALYPGGTALEDDGLTAKLKDLVVNKRVSETELVDIDAEELEAVIKLVNRLVEQANGNPAISDYFLTQENKDYHATEIEQLKQLQQRLDQLLTTKNMYDAIEALYDEATESAGLKLPVASPMSPEQMGVVLSLADEIGQLEEQWDVLGEKERLLVGEPATEHINELTDAVTRSREGGMTAEELFRSRVTGVGEMITGDAPYSIDDPDKVADMIGRAETQYDSMTNEQRAYINDSKLLLDELKRKLDAHVTAEAAEFAKYWLTVDYNGTSDEKGDEAFAAVKRLDSDKTKPGYAHRVSLANAKYNALPICVKAAVDEIFSGPTVPGLYGDTFKAVKNVSGLTDKELADAFITGYLTDGGSAVKKATYANYSKLSQAVTPWHNLTPAVQALVNQKLGLDAEKMIGDANAISTNLGLAQGFINSQLRNDGSVVTAGNDKTKATITAAKSQWDKLLPAVREAANYLLVNTYKGITYPALYAAVSYSGGGGGGGGSAPVIVDGVKYNIGAYVADGDRTIVTVDQKELAKLLSSAKENVVVPVSRGENVNAVTARLVVASVNEMAQKKMTLSVQVGGMSYDMPAVAMDTSALMKELGASDPTKVPVNVTIQELTNDDVHLGEGELVIAPVQFTVTAAYGGKSIDVDVFRKFVRRVIEVPDGDVAESITTAVIVENGKERHVPTDVFQKDGKWYARINSLTNSVYALISNEKSFTDAEGKWFSDIVTEMASRVVINGKAEGVFDGEANITRAEFAAVLVRALGLPENGDGSVFADVANDDWYYGAVGKAYEYGLINGRSEGHFAPGASITRQEAMAMVHRTAAIAEYVGETGTLDAFKDAADVSAWALEDAKWNVGSGLISGNSRGELNSQSNITRGETATVILRLLQKSDLVDVRTVL